MNVWQHPSTINAPATKAQRERINTLLQNLGRRQGTLLLGPAHTPGAFSIGITMDSQALRTAARTSEMCGMLFHDGVVIWGTRDEMFYETRLVDKWTAKFIPRPEYETEAWSAGRSLE